MAGLRSGNHESAQKRPDGTWTCSKCGAESLDFELFEEVGVMESCLPDPTGAEKTAAILAAGQAKQWIEEAEAAHNSMKKMGTAASDAAEILSKSLKSLAAGAPLEQRRSAVWKPQVVEEVKSWDGTTLRRFTYDPEDLIGRKFKIHTEKYEKKEPKTWEELRSAGTGTRTTTGLSPSSKSWLDEMSGWFTTWATSASGPETVEPATSSESGLPVKNWASGYGSHRAITRTTRRSRIQRMGTEQSDRFSRKGRIGK